MCWVLYIRYLIILHINPKQWVLLLFQLYTLGNQPPKKLSDLLGVHSRTQCRNTRAHEPTKPAPNPASTLHSWLWGPPQTTPFFSAYHFHLLSITSSSNQKPALPSTSFLKISWAAISHDHHYDSYFPLSIQYLFLKCLPSQGPGLATA